MDTKKLLESVPNVHPGQVWEDIHGPARVMCICEGWAMLRRPGAMPFLLNVRDMLMPGKTGFTVARSKTP